MRRLADGVAADNGDWRLAHLHQLWSSAQRVWLGRERIGGKCVRMGHTRCGGSQRVARRSRAHQHQLAP